MGNNDREQFITDQRFKLETTINSLVNYRVTLNPKYRTEIVDFFEALLKDEKANNEEKLMDLARVYGRKIGIFSKIDEDSHEFFSKTLEGLGLIKKEIQSIELKYISGIGSRLRKKKDNSIDREYTNITNNGTMLILDDDIFILNILSRAFESNGYDVIVTSNPYEAIDIAKAGQADIAVIDLVMPKLDGFQVLDRIKDEDSELPIVFITGSDKTETKVNALKRGVEDYITKPFKVEEVVARVESILNRNRNYRVNLNVDELTGAYTRKYFMDSVKKHRSNSELKDYRSSVGFLDIDRFKYINDTYGHLIGDKILKFLVDSAKKFLPNSSIYRFGGDEFLIFFKNSGELEAKKKLEIFRSKIEKTENKFDELSENVRITLSIGVAEFNRENSPLEIIDRADRSLYEAKGSGRNRVISYSQIESESCTNKKVFIIDSENIASTLLRSRLKSTGYDVKLADDISDINKGLDQNVDLLMLDFTTYKKCTGEIDKEKILQNKILLMLAEDEKEELELDDNLNVEDIVVKPLSVIELENKVKKIIS